MGSKYFFYWLWWACLWLTLSSTRLTVRSLICMVCSTSQILNHQLFLSLRTRPSIPQASLTYWSLQVQILFPPHIYFFTFSQHNLSDLSLFSFLLYPFLRSILPLNTQFTKFFLFLHKIFWLYFYLLFNFIFFLLNLLPYSSKWQKNSKAVFMLCVTEDTE